MPHSTDKCRVYVKGAPEYIIELCDETLDHQVEQVPFIDDKETIRNTIIGLNMAGNSMLKVISYAFKEIALE